MAGTGDSGGCFANVRIVEQVNEIVSTERRQPDSRTRDDGCSHGQKVDASGSADDGIVFSET